MLRTRKRPPSLMNSGSQDRGEYGGRDAAHGREGAARRYCRNCRPHLDFLALIHVISCNLDSCYPHEDSDCWALMNRPEMTMADKSPSNGFEGLFQRLFARQHRIAGEDHQPVSFDGTGCWWNDPQATPLAAGRGFNVQAVGESRFQEEIGSIVGGRRVEGHNCQVPAELVFAETERDPEGIGVRINNLLVGYLPFETARQVRPLLEALSAKDKAITCKAKIVGGWDRGSDDQGFFGVKLSLSLPPKVDRRARGAS
jgi:hypothetical protein